MAYETLHYVYKICNKIISQHVQLCFFNLLLKSIVLRIVFFCTLLYMLFIVYNLLIMHFEWLIGDDLLMISICIVIWPWVDFELTGARFYPVIWFFFSILLNITVYREADRRDILRLVSSKFHRQRKWQTRLKPSLHILIVILTYLWTKSSKVSPCHLIFYSLTRRSRPLLQFACT